MKTSFFYSFRTVRKLLMGLKKMIEQMQTSDDVSIYSLGGTTEDEIGSDPTKIVDAVNEASKEDTFLVFADIGSAILNAEMAKDMLEEDQQERYYLVDGPLVEGAFAAAITAGSSNDLEQIMAEAKKKPGKKTGVRKNKLEGKQ